MFVNPTTAKTVIATIFTIVLFIVHPFQFKQLNSNRGQTSPRWVEDISGAD